MGLFFRSLSTVELGDGFGRCFQGSPQRRGDPIASRGEFGGRNLPSRGGNTVELLGVAGQRGIALGSHRLDDPADRGHRALGNGLGPGQAAGNVTHAPQVHSV